MALTGLTNLQPLHIKTVGIGTFDNAVSIGGTLTYEDVTNVDAIGIITARSGVNVSGGQLDVGSNIKLGNAGVITATSFVGSGSGLTNLSASLFGQTDVGISTISKVGIGTTNPNKQLHVFDSSATSTTARANTVARFLSNASNADCNIQISNAVDHSAQIGIVGNGAEVYIAQDGLERFRINSTGQVLIGEESVTGGTQKLVIGNGGAENFEFSPAMTSNNLNGGLIEYLHRGDGNTRPDLNLYTGGAGNIKFYTNGNERLRFASNGGVGIATDKIPRNYFLHIAAPSQDYTNTSTQLTDGGGIMFQHTDTLASTGRTYPGIFWSGNTSALGRARAGIIGVTASNNDATHIAFLTRTAANGTAFYPSDERVRITNTGQLFIGTTSGSEILCIKRDDNTGPTITLENNANKAYINNWGSSGGGSGRTNRFEINATLQTQASICAPYITFMTGGTGDSNEKVRIHNSGTLQAFNHATSRNGIVQIKQVTSTTRYAGNPGGVDLITGSTFTPKTSAPRFLIMIFCPVNTSDDSDAGNGNTNFYFYGRLEYRKNGGSWLECNDQGSTNEQGGYAAHIELSPNRTGADVTGGGYWSGNRYRMEHKTATILVTNVGDCGSSGNVQFKLRSYGYGGNFIQIGQPHGRQTDDNYGVQPWGFTVFELAPDNNTYTAY